MADRTRHMVAAVMPAVLTGTRVDLLEVEAADDEIDALHGQIITYLGRISQTRLSAASSEELAAVMTATNDLEAIGDIVETNLVALGLNRIHEGLVVSDITREKLEGFHAVVLHGLDLAMMALTQKDEEAARAVAAMKNRVNELEQDALVHEADRLVAPEPRRVATYRFEIDVVANLKRIFYFSKRIARLAIPTEERAEM
jgi:phosphate:Na+ symporter